MKHFAKGDFLLEYGGELISSTEAEARETNDNNETVCRFVFKFKGKQLW